MSDFSWYLIGMLLVNLLAFVPVRKAFLTAIADSAERARKYDEAVARGKQPVTYDPATGESRPDMRPVVITDTLLDMFMFSLGAIALNTVVAIVVTWILLWVRNLFA